MSRTDITLTGRAAEHVKTFLDKQGNGLGLRLGIKTAGCSGQQYVVETAEAINKDDHTFESNGVKIVIDDNSLKYLSGTQLDFVREGLNSGFRFNNPNVADTCGCGESFTVDPEHASN
ncbi:MAG: iron-sulfur cluster assembly protein IscA [Thiotrichales bacterium]|nr:iron-sulfur cluster assembly protein IscA [Thiotrichales bacterium]